MSLPNTSMHEVTAVMGMRAGTGIEPVRAWNGSPRAGATTATVSTTLTRTATHNYR